jgi:glycolate oxidase
MPSADSVVLGLARMNAVLETDYPNRFIRVEAGRTNLSVTGAVESDGWFYAPDPSSQLACAIAGNIAMNSGGAHCLKYGVTTNNLLGVTLVTMAGEVLQIGGPWCDAGGLDLLGVICGSEGQLGRHHPRGRSAGGDRIHGPPLHSRDRGFRPCRLSRLRGAADRRGRGQRRRD